MARLDWLHLFLCSYPILSTAFLLILFPELQDIALFELEAMPLWLMYIYSGSLLMICVGYLVHVVINNRGDISKATWFVAILFLNIFILPIYWLLCIRPHAHQEST